MKTKKNLFLACMFAIISSRACAAGYTPTVDLSPATLGDTTPGGLFSAFSAAPVDTSNAQDNTVLVSQGSSTYANVAYVEQTGGVGNVAILLQDNASDHNAAAYQAGSHNFVLIYQR